jgi:hypothetical protein
MQHELFDLRTESNAQRHEIMKLGNALTQKVAREQELERELAQAIAARKQAVEREGAAVLRADGAAQKMNNLICGEELLKRQLLAMEDEKAKTMHELRETRKERDALKKIADGSNLRNARTKKKVGGRDARSASEGRRRR